MDRSISPGQVPLLGACLVYKISVRMLRIWDPSGMPVSVVLEAHTHTHTAKAGRKCVQRKTIHIAYWQGATVLSRGQQQQQQQHIDPTVHG